MGGLSTEAKRRQEVAKPNLYRIANIRAKLYPLPRRNNWPDALAAEEFSGRGRPQWPMPPLAGLVG